MIGHRQKKTAIGQVQKFKTKKPNCVIRKIKKIKVTEAVLTTKLKELSEPMGKEVRQTS